MKHKTPGEAARGSVNHRADDARTLTPYHRKRQRLIGTLYPRWTRIGGSA